MSTLGTAMDAAASALAAERQRIEVAVSNLANAESTRGPDGQPYRRRDVVLSSMPMETFDRALSKASATGVKVSEVLDDTSTPRQRYEPSHPDADANGYVSLPNVDPAEEMVDMLGAARAYQANLAAISLIGDTVKKALELGRG
jgi:flagellar basal-body rod protein FlgC